MKRFTQFFFSLVALLALSLTACEQIVIDDIKQPGPSFSMDQFEANLIEALDGKVTGYSYSIGLNGNAARQGAGGFAVMPGTSPDYQTGIEMSHTSRMHIASVTKPVTALTLFKTMNDKGMQDIDIPFVQFLPTHWTVHPSLNDISLRQLLEHTSGILNSGNVYDDVKDWVALGVNQSDKGKYSYNNANYSVLRIVTAYIHSGELLNEATFANDDDNLDQLTNDIFMNLMKSKVLIPAQVTHDPLFPSRTNPVYFYNYSDLTQAPWITSSFTKGPGAFGLYLSANEVASVMAHARHLDGYLPQPFYDYFFAEDVGLKVSNGDQGTYLHHGGDWISNGRGVNTRTMVFPNNVEATIMINCRTHEAGDDRALLQNAYDDAWTN
ncbi:MAG: serine hydrolase [Bacteroidota bacterium]